MRHRTNAGRALLAACLGLGTLAAGLSAAGLSAAAAGAQTAGWHATEVYPEAPDVGNSRSSPSSQVPGWYALTCGSPGNCVAGGSYPRRNHQVRPMVATETSGVWAPARRLWLPRTATNPGQQGGITAISCPTPGWCAATGWLAPAQAFVITESGGTWNRPHVISLPPNAREIAGSRLGGISCTRPGSCVAVGSYFTTAFEAEPLAVTDTGGHWAAATEVKALGDYGVLNSLACPSAGLCVAVGEFVRGSFPRGMEAVYSGGTWQRPTSMLVPPHYTDPNTELDSVSCSSARFCMAVGSTIGAYSSLYAIRQDGHWQRARRFTVAPPGGTPYQKNGPADITTVSCTPTACLAGGSYFQVVTGLEPPYVATFSGGRWRDPVPVGLPPNATARSSDGLGALGAVACSAGPSCAAIGDYFTKRGFYRGWAAAGPP